MRRALALAVLALAACGESDMAEQPKYGPYEAAAAFPDGRAAQLPPPGTVARDEARAGRALAVPPPASAALSSRGEERYRIFCAPCHGEAGAGDGPVAGRTFPPPPSFGEQRTRRASDAELVAVIGEGKGIMRSFAARVPAHDRWAIVAHIRRLQDRLEEGE